MSRFKLCLRYMLCVGRYVFRYVLVLNLCSSQPGTTVALLRSKVAGMTQ